MKLRPYGRIVVEGMDGSGKSTLSKTLVEFLGDNAHFVPGYNRLPGGKSPMPQWWMEELAKNPVGKIVVHDRFFYPELVYGPILRGRTDTGGASTRSYVQNFLREHAFLIYCRPSVETLRKGVLVEEQMQGVLNNFHRLLVMYDHVIMKEAEYYTHRFFYYDWENDRHLASLIRTLTGYIYE